MCNGALNACWDTATARRLWTEQWQHDQVYRNNNYPTYSMHCHGLLVTATCISECIWILRQNHIIKLLEDYALSWSPAVCNWCACHRIWLYSAMLKWFLSRDAMQRAVIARQVACLSVCNVHTGWNSSKIISRLISWEPQHRQSDSTWTLLTQGWGSVWESSISWLFF